MHKNEGKSLISISLQYNIIVVVVLIVLVLVLVVVFIANCTHKHKDIKIACQPTLGNWLYWSWADSFIGAFKWMQQYTTLYCK